MINFNYVNFPNIGFIKAVLSDEQLKPIKDEINSIKNNFKIAKKYNYGLAGNIDKEYKLIECYDYVERLLSPLAQSYLSTNEYGNSILKMYANLGDYEIDFSELKLIDLWVNYQSKHEFNPTHDHGGILSFTIWIDIPYSMEDENINPSAKDSNNPRIGCFEFNYTNTLGDRMDYPIRADKRYNNGLIMFPARLCHTVYPFYTSNKYRISVSGNLGYK